MVTKFDRTHLLSLAAFFGLPTLDPRHPVVVRQIRPQDLKQANPNTLSSRYGLAAFPFHTDAAHWRNPADYVILYCVAPGSGDRSTLLIDTHKWALSTRALHIISTSIWRAGYAKPFLCSAIELEQQIWKVRYDTACMKPFYASGIAAQTSLSQLIEESRPVEIRWCQDMLLVLDNRRMLHARGAASAPDTDRILERVLIGGSYENVGLSSTVAQG